jgi:outer membrane protein assembly factor BamB
MKTAAAIGCLFLLAGCSTVPAAREVHFDVQWIRGTSIKDHYGFRRSERSAPVNDGKIIYQGNSIDSFVAVDSETGNILWRFPIRNGAESGAVVDGNGVYFGASDGQVYGLNKTTGKPIWTFPTRVENLATPLVSEGIVYVLSGNNVVYALDAKTGKQLWLYNRGDVSSLSIRGGTRPTLYKGTLYTGFSDGYLTALNPRDGSLYWERKLATHLRFVDVDATPVVDDDYIWVSSFDGALFCLSRTDGQVVWRLDEGGAVPVTIQGDNLYYASLNHAVYALNKKTGAQRWKHSYEETYGVPTQPVLYRGLVVFGTSNGDLIALSELNGNKVASYRPGSGIFATPLLNSKDGEVFVFSNQANLHALKIAWRRKGESFP